MVPNGHAPKVVQESPKLAGVDLSGVGQPERAPLLVTKTPLFPATEAACFHPGRAVAYLAKGKQYIVVAIGNRNFPAELVALTLPWPADRVQDYWTGGEVCRIDYC
jgi:hypothetical protein